MTELEIHEQDLDSGSSHDPRSHRRHPGRQDRPGGRRRRPRERGRLHHGGGLRHARGGELHGDPRPGHRVPAVRGVAPRRAGHPADGHRHHGRARGRLHGLDRLPSGHHHGHQRLRPGDHGEGRDQHGGHTARLPEARPRLPVAGEGWRRAPPRGTHRSRGRPRHDGRPLPRRRDLRGDERGRHDGAHARADPCGP